MDANSGENETLQHNLKDNSVEANNQNNNRNASGESKSHSSTSSESGSSSQKYLKAPYSQPVLDASKVKRSNSSVNERLLIAKERRLQQQKQHDIELSNRRQKEDEALMKWVSSQEERKKRMEENKIKEENRRKEVEERKIKQLAEDQKRAEARVAKTEQQANVVMRKKRNSSVDRTKRWSWGSGGMGSSGGFCSRETPPATLIGTAPSPFNYFDPNSLQRSNALSPMSGSGATEADRFSKSPLVMGTAHMAFASGLRTYNSPSSKPASPGSPQLTDPAVVSPRLLAPTKASIARHKAPEPDDKDVANGERSRSADRKATKPGSIQSEGEKTPLSHRPRTSRSPAVAKSSSNVSSPVASASPHLRARMKKSSSDVNIAASSYAGNKSKDEARTSKKTTPVIKQTLRPATSPGSRLLKTFKKLTPDKEKKPFMTLKVKEDKKKDKKAGVQVKDKKADKKEKPKKETEKKAVPIKTRKSLPASKHQANGTPTQPAQAQQEKDKSLPTTPTQAAPEIENKNVTEQAQPAVALPPQNSVIAESQAAQEVVAESEVNQQVGAESAVNQQVDAKSEVTQQVNAVSEVAHQVDAESEVTQQFYAESEVDAEPEVTEHVNAESEIDIEHQNAAAIVVQKVVESAQQRAQLEQPQNETLTAETPLVVEEQNAETAVDDQQAESSQEPTEDIQQEVPEPEKQEVNLAQKIETTNTVEENSSGKNEETESKVVVDLDRQNHQLEFVRQDSLEMDQQPESEQRQVNVAEDPNQRQEVMPHPEEEQPESEQQHSDPEILQPESEQQQSGTEDQQRTQEEPESEQRVVNSRDTSAEERQDLQEPESEQQEEDELQPESEQRHLVEESDLVEEDRDDFGGSTGNDAANLQDSLDHHKEDVAPEVLESKSEVESKQEADQLLDLKDHDATSTVELISLEDKTKDEQIENNQAEVKEEGDILQGPNSAKECWPENDGKEENSIDVQQQILEPSSQEGELVSTDTPSEPQNLGGAELKENGIEQTGKISPSSSHEVAEELLIAVERVESKVAEVSTPVNGVNGKNEGKKSTENSPDNGQPKKKQKKLTDEEQAYKEALTAKRREAKEKRERELEEKKERQRLDAEERAKRAEDARKMMEEARLEALEQERLEEEEERKKEEEKKELEKRQLEAIRLHKEKLEQKAKEEAEKSRLERDLIAQKKDDERLARKKRLEMIMRRTRGGDSPQTTPSSSPSASLRSSPGPAGEDQASDNDSKPNGGDINNHDGYNNILDKDTNEQLMVPLPSTT